MNKETTEYYEAMKEKRQEIQQDRLEYAKEELDKLSIDIVQETASELQFYHNGYLVKYFPYTGWHTGKSIKDGRGWKKLKEQLTA